jgi:hypothetical protein
VSDEGLDLLASGIAQGLHATKVSCVGLDQGGIELMLPNNLAQTVADLRAAVVAVAI